MPFILPSLYLCANAGGAIVQNSLWVSTTGSDAPGRDGDQAQPFLTIKHAFDTATFRSGNSTPEGWTIYVEAGNWQYPGSQTYTCDNTYVTLAGAPGTALGDVVITSFDTNYGFVVPKLHLQNLKITCNIPSGNPTACIVWMDGCESTTTVALKTTSDWSNIYTTETYFHDFPGDDNAATGNGSLFRSCWVKDGGEDAYRQSGGLITNCRATNLNVLNSTSSHADVVQRGDVTLQQVIYGLKVDGTINAQGISNGLTSVTDTAYVGINFEEITIQNLMAERPWVNAYFAKIAAQDLRST